MRMRLAAMARAFCRRRSQLDRIETRVLQLPSGRVYLIRLARLERQLHEVLVLAHAGEVTLSDIDHRLATVEQRFEHDHR